MFDVLHLDLDAVSLLAAGYALLCEVVQLQELLLQLQSRRGKVQAHTFWLEHELLIVEHIQANAHAQGVHFHHNAFDSIILQPLPPALCCLANGTGFSSYATCTLFACLPVL